MEKEIVEDLALQLKDFIVTLREINETLAANSSELKCYEDFGSIADRVYGAISMFGPNEISDYVRTVKELCYKCSRSDNPLAYPKVQKLLVTCVEHFEFLRDNLSSEDELKKAIFKINLSNKKAERVIASYLFSVKDPSVGFEGEESFILIFDKAGKFEIDFKERGEVYVPPPKFYNAHGGFNKDLANSDLDVAAVVIDTSCSSNIWMEMVKSAHEKRPAVPLILIAKDVNELGSIDREKLGVRDILSDRTGLNKVMVRLDELTEEMARQAKLEEEQSKLSADDFIEVASTSFKLCLESPYDVYLRVADRFVKIVQKGSAFEKERLEKHIKMGAEIYFIPAEQYNLYMTNCSSELNDFFCDDSIESDAKQLRLSEFATDVYSFVEHQGVDEEKIALAKDYIDRAGEHIAAVAAEHETCRDFILDLVAMEHAVSASMIGGLFLKILGAGKEVYDDIVLACFFHDIGLSGTSSTIRKERIELMSVEDKEIFLSHHDKSADMLQGYNLKPAIIDAIRQHHMRMDGFGFPEFEKGQAHKVNRIAELIGLVDELLGLMEKAVDEDLDYDPVEYLRPMLCLKFSPTIQKAYDAVFPPK